MNAIKNLLRKYVTSPAISVNLKEKQRAVFSNLDYDYLCNPNNSEEISQNVKRRKGVGNIERVMQLSDQLQRQRQQTNEPKYEEIERELHEEAFKIPNKTHPAVICYNDEAKIVNYTGAKPSFDSKPLEFHAITKKLHLLRTEQLGNLAGSRSYYFLGELAELENALIKYTVANLLKENFKLLSVPDVLDRSVIESCGMNTRGQRTQVYSLDAKRHGADRCLSGTSEMAIAAYFGDKIVRERHLPVQVAAVSRCYRAETSSLAEEKGIYRVHQFTKVEMFAVTAPAHSEHALDRLRRFEEKNFGDLGLHLRTLDMPAHELGAPAYRKYDVEAWLPGRNMYGEVSSCSNCTDYQSRRLNIRCESDKGVEYAHTLNGTACAIPRMLIAVLETFQRDNGTVEIPQVLRKYMNGKTSIGKQKNIPELKLIKNKK